MAGVHGHVALHAGLILDDGFNIYYRLLTILLFDCFPVLSRNCSIDS